MFTSMDVPHSQNTAPVLEFRCLYTADIRRKQKRWQDGKVKFHTFNKRVMVYDEKSNFVGDTHWKGGLDFEEGEELELDRGGILVEVGECIGKRDQDLTELVDKRVKDREERVAAKVGVSPSASLYRGQSTPAASALLRPKPLNAMLTPSGHYGRAVMPTTSPFEERQATKRDENEPPAKKRRQNDVTSSKNGYAQNLMGATLSLSSSKPSSTPTIRYEPFKAHPVHPQSSEAIDLTLDDDEERKASDLRRKIAQEQRAAIERPPPRQKNFKRSPPAKSGYASNLTGTPLMLSRSDIRPPAKTMMTKVTIQQHDLDDESSEAECESFVRLQSPKPALQKVQKPAARQPEKENIIHFSDSEDSSAGTLPPPKAVKAVRKSKAPSPQVRIQADQDSSSEGESFVEVERPPTNIIKPTKQPKETLARKRRSEQGTSTIELDSSPQRHPKKRQKETPAPKVKGSSKESPEYQSRSSSPRMDNATPDLHQAGSFSRSAIQKSSAIEPTPDKPRSALRIKSRPARQMMMLMSRPSSRPSASNASFESSRPKARTQPKPVDTSDEVVLSQATAKLTAFCENQQAELDARLKRIASRPDFDEEFGDVMSSDPDTGIDHRTIDLLLTRKTLPMQDQVESVRTVALKNNADEKRRSPDRPAETLPRTTSSTSDKRGSPAQMDLSGQPKHILPLEVTPVEDEQDERLRPMKSVSTVKEILTSSDNRSAPAITCHVNGRPSFAKQPTPDITIGILDIQGKRSVASIKEATPPGKKPRLFQKPNSESLPTAEVQNLSPKSVDMEHVITSSNSLEEELRNAIVESLKDPSARNAPRDKEPPAQNQIKFVGSIFSLVDKTTEETIPSNLTPHAKQPLATSPAPPLTPHKDSIFGNLIQASPRFLAMISPSSATKTTPTESTSPPKEPPIPQLRTSHSFEEQQTINVSEPAVMPPAVTKSFSSVESALHDRPVPGQGFSSAGISASTSAVASAARSLSTPDLASDSFSKTGPGTATGIQPPIPRPRLANPATRGKSLQTLAASTVDSMGTLPLFNPMPPPPVAVRGGVGVVTRVDRSTLRDGRDVEREERERVLVNEKLPAVPPDGPWSREAWDLFGWSGPGVAV
ncbi:hypothetical protein VTL71DRAFT_6351 [Oculimacula yallundae]|uniref:5'-3' DNA helicase ZGRF1-like N-terminal domain-containing protein n=1 Tax=Oculimacula yallundae TaxID=86028 RepID=A0ABR4BWQ6_9HELO